VYCRAGYYAQCDTTEPRTGTAFFGGPEAAGAYDGMHEAGTIGIIGVYPPTVQAFPIGEAMNKNLAILAGNCNHRRYVPELLGLVASGAVEPDQVLTQRGEIVSAIEAYEAFDRRDSGWTEVELEPVTA
jgi:threonine dehydrogenase-like Zn-dependent dehydrogenase